MQSSFPNTSTASIPLLVQSSLPADSGKAPRGDKAPRKPLATKATFRRTFYLRRKKSHHYKLGTVDLYEITCYQKSTELPASGVKNYSGLQN